MRITVLLMCVVLCVAGLAGGGCVTAKPVSGEADYTRVFQGYGGEDNSLFRSDSAVLTDADIDRILSYRPQLRGPHRLAVLDAAPASRWSEAHAQVAEENSAALLARLGGAPEVREAVLLPGLLVPEKKTVPYLREAAARFQADLLLVYVTRVTTYSKYRSIGRDEANATCAVDAVLIDVRTGIVPFTARAAEAIRATRTADDVSFSESVARAVAEAEGRALQGVAERTVAWLGGTQGG